MAAVIGFAFLALVLVLAVGAITGRVQARSFCGPADARKDLRIRDAFDEGNDARPRSA